LWLIWRSASLGWDVSMDAVGMDEMVWKRGKCESFLSFLCLDYCRLARMPE
jgi:hypothetical protein